MVLMVLAGRDEVARGDLADTAGRRRLGRLVAAARLAAGHEHGEREHEEGGGGHPDAAVEGHGGCRLAGTPDMVPHAERAAGPHTVRMSRVAAGALVFSTSAAVLVLEILAVRLLAPYVGVTLETYTAIIGVVLAGISTGSWAGGRLADRLSPGRLLGPLLILGGAFALLVTPIGRVVGRLSAVATAGAILGTLVTGFLLVAALPVSRIVLGVGVVLVALGVVLSVRLRGGAGPP